MPNSKHITADQLQTSLTKVKTEIDKKTDTWYGTSSTSSSTSAKTVTCAGFTLKAGAVVSVLFSTANTANAPTLNVNSTGAYSIYFGSSVTSSTNPCKWLTNTLVTFIFSGTYWYVVTVTPDFGGNTFYGTCATAATTAAKTSSISDFRLRTGTIVIIRATTDQTYTSGAITLNVNSTGAKTIYYKNAATSSTNQLTWTTGDILGFVYDGSYWRLFSHSGQTGGGGGSADLGLSVVSGKLCVTYDDSSSQS